MRSVNSKAATLTLAALAALACAAPGRAEGRQSRFNVPFEFVVGSEVLPAGQYELTLDGFNRLALRSIDRHTTRFLPVSASYETRSRKELGAGKLRFTRHGDTMFLSVAWAGVEEDGRTIVSSKQMIETAENAAHGSGPATITLTGGNQK